MKLQRLQKHIKDSAKKLELATGEVTLGKVIGQGGNGIVYSASIYGREVAIKFLVVDQTGDSYRRKLTRFLSEYFNIVTMEDHRGIVKYIDYDQYRFTDEEGELQIPLIIMKLYDGSLEAKRKKEVTAEGFLALFSFLMEVVKKIHQAGIVHRDIKPENILFNSEGFVLGDFGIAGFNPEVFQLRATTGSSERLGNRLFSAPEQEDGGTSAHPTMDIYAIGQVLQWYVKGKTHRGTGRAMITDEFPELELYDRVIERCLENEPANRFQQVEDIERFMHDMQKKDPFDYLEILHNAFVKSFPKNDYGIVYSNSKEKISHFFRQLQLVEKQLGRHLWWHNGSSGIHFKLTAKENDVWKLDRWEYHFAEIWVNYDEAHHNDFALLRYEAGEPFDIDGKKTFYTAIVDGEHHISFSEVSNGYAEINGETVDLSAHSVEVIERRPKEGYIFIATNYNNVLVKENDQAVRSLIETFPQLKDDVKLERLQDFQSDIRYNKNRYIEEGQ